MDLKRYAVILTAIMMMCTSGCGNVKSTNKTEKANSSSVTKSVASTVSMPDPVPVPEGGWNYKNVIDTVTVDGKTLKEGFTADDLGDEYEIQLDSQTENKSYYYLTKNDKNYYSFISRDESKMNNLGQAKPDCFTTAYDEDADLENLSPMIEKYSDCSFNGVKIGDTLDDIIEAYGQPDQQTDVRILYRDKSIEKNILAFTLNENGQIYYMGIFNCQG